MYMQVTSPSDDATVRLQLNFQPSNCTESKANEGPATLNLNRVFKSHVQYLLHAWNITSPFLLVGQPAPNAFVLVSKQAEHGTWLDGAGRSSPSRPRFHVIIGPQLCTCMDSSRTDVNEPVDCNTITFQPCVHILFVLFRVLHASLDDPSLSLVPLPTTKTESLIQAHMNRKQRQLSQSVVEQKCYLSQVSMPELKTIQSQVHSPDQTRPTSPDTTVIPLAIPKPVHPSRIPLPGSQTDQTPQLLAAMHATLQNSPDCCELSKLTTGIQPSPRREAASVDAIAVTSSSTTTTCASRTSSTESADSPARVTRAYRSARSMKHQSDLAKGSELNHSNSLTRRPRTVPQPDPPPHRTGQHGARTIRHACSTTFRPIRDQSPEHKLTTIHSEETSAENSLKHDLISHRQKQARWCDEPDHIRIGLRRSSSFRHWTSGPFKPIPGKPCSPRSDSNPTQDCSMLCTHQTDHLNSVCALCLQYLDDGSTSTETLLQCQTAGATKRQCMATFHRSCCQIWLEEIETDGDSAHCPVCLCPWETLPLDCLIQPIKELPKATCPCSETGHTGSVGDQSKDNQSDPNEFASSSTSTEPSHDSGFESREPASSVQCQSNTPQLSCLSASTIALTCPFPDYKLCVAAFSLEIADGIASRNCPHVRQVALQHAAQLTVRRILLARQQHQLQARSETDSGSGKIEEFRADENRKPQILCTEVTDEPDCLRIMFRLIQHLFDDPVDAVFIDALRAFRELLGYLVCFNAETQTALQRAIGPIIRRLLRFTGGASVLWSLRHQPHMSVRPTPVFMHQHSTDSNPESIGTNAPTPSHAGLGLSKSQISGPINGTQLHPPDPSSLICAHGSHLGCGLSRADRDTLTPPANLRDRANLALATLVELAKGQTGALAIGRDVGCASDCLPVCGLHHMTRFVLSSAKFHATHLVGRLTLLDKLIRMDQAIVVAPSESVSSPAVASSPPSATDRLARRHLCSSLVFARRHLVPPVPNSGMAACVPRHYELQPADQGDVTHDSDKPGTDNAGFCLISNADRDAALTSLYNTQLKASRVARRVFLTAARALLTYDSRHLSDWIGAAKAGQTNYGTREFCPREFVELEINRTEAPLAAWLRNKLASVLYPNLVPGLDTPLIPIRMTVTEAQPTVLPRQIQHSRHQQPPPPPLPPPPPPPLPPPPQQQQQPSSHEKSDHHNHTNQQNNRISGGNQKRAALPNSQTLGNIRSPPQQYYLQQQQQQQQKHHHHQHPQPSQRISNSFTCPSSRTHSNSPVQRISTEPTADFSQSSDPPIPPPRRLICPHGNLTSRINQMDRTRGLSSTRKLSHDRSNTADDSVRRNSWTSEPTGPMRSEQHGSDSTGTHCVRIALEPAYDLVALSESGNYSSVSEGDAEDEDEDEVGEEQERNRCPGRTHSSPDKQDVNVVLSEPTYGGRSLGSEAELQTEQAAVLRSALRRCSRSLRPLLPVPALSMVMEAFRSTNQIPSTDEYYESIDWIRGPILGQGAFSQCYQARDTRTGLLMAVKRIRLGGGSVFPILTDQAPLDPCRTGRVSLAQSRQAAVKQPANPIYPELSPDAAAQLIEVQAEVNIMLQLNHPNVLRLFGAVYCSRRAVVDLFIEWMPGGSVTGLLRQYGAFNESVTLAYGLQVVRGLAYLHRNGILHRDLKGANLLVDTTGSVVRISDFGASARLSGEESVTGQFQGQVIGTFSFMAPEVLRGEAYGRACDIWSVGCCLIEMLTSKPPWHDTRLTNRYALMFTIATSRSPPTYPDGLHPDVLAVLNACFSRNAAHRPTASKLLTFRAFARLIEPSSNTREEDKLSASSVPEQPRDSYSNMTCRGHSSLRRKNSSRPVNGTDKMEASSTGSQQQEQGTKGECVAQPVLQTTRVL